MRRFTLSGAVLTARAVLWCLLPQLAVSQQPGRRAILQHLPVRMTRAGQPERAMEADWKEIQDEV
jgi:hypothetical protein